MNKTADIIEQYIQEKNIDKLKEILELSRQKVIDLEDAVGKVEEEKLLEAFRMRDKSYLQKILQDMDVVETTDKPEQEITEEEEKPLEEDSYEVPDTFARY